MIVVECCGKNGPDAATHVDLLASPTGFEPVLPPERAILDVWRGLHGFDVTRKTSSNSRVLRSHALLCSDGFSAVCQFYRDLIATFKPSRNLETHNHQ
jgi:hypothetical protein